MAHARRFCESFRDRIPNGLVGSVRFDANGDIATSPVTILRVEPGAGTLPTFLGAAVDRVPEVPVELVH
jgi:hypothetical protein